MFERFTAGARQAVVRAQLVARERDDRSIGTEHLLLVVLAAADVTALAAHQLDTAAVMRAVGELSRSDGNADAVETGRPRRRGWFGRRVGARDGGWMPFTEEATLTFDHASREATDLGHRHIGVEHLLLALLRPGSGLARRAVERSGADPDAVARAVRDRVRRSA